MGMTRRTGGRQQGAQDHDEGQHGDKTQRHIAAAHNHPQANETAGGNAPNHPAMNESGPQYDRDELRAHAPPSKTHLVGRSQHDEADLNAEKTRLVKDSERHDHIAHDEWSERSARASAKRKS